LHLPIWIRRLCLRMQTRPANRNQIAKGLILTYSEFLVTFMAVALDATFKFMLLRITENCYVRQRKRRDRLTILKNIKMFRVYHSVVVIFCHWMSCGIFFWKTSSHSAAHRLLYCNMNYYLPDIFSSSGSNVIKFSRIIYTCFCVFSVQPRTLFHF